MGRAAGPLFSLFQSLIKKVISTDLHFTLDTYGEISMKLKITKHHKSHDDYHVFECEFDGFDFAGVAMCEIGDGAIFDFSALAIGFPQHYAAIDFAFW